MAKIASVKSTAAKQQEGSPTGIYISSCLARCRDQSNRFISTTWFSTNSRASQMLLYASLSLIACMVWRHALPEGNTSFRCQSVLDVLSDTVTCGATETQRMETGTFYGATSVRRFFPSDPNHSDEDSAEEFENIDVDVDNAPDCQQHIAAALAEDAVDKDNLLSPPRKKRKVLEASQWQGVSRIGRTLAQVYG